LKNTTTTERGAKHWNSAPAIPVFTHRQTEICQWETNEDINVRFWSKRLAKSRMGVLCVAQKHV